MFTQRVRQLQAVWGPCFSLCLPSFPWRLHHRLSSVWNLAPGCFGYVRKFFTAASAQSSRWLHCARSERVDVGWVREGKRGKRREEERREGQKKSRGGQALGGGRAKSQEHYITAGAESKREGYESVYWLHLSPSLDRGQSPCVWSPQYLSWSWDLWRPGQYSVCVYMCVFVDRQQDLYCTLDWATPEGLTLSAEVQKRVIED